MNKTIGIDREERLKKDEEIKPLFKSKSKFNSGQIRISWYIRDESNKNEPLVKFMVGCPKRKMKSAVARNRIKRLLREAYRLQKPNLIEACLKTNVKIGISFMFIGNQMPEFEYIYKCMERALEKNISQLTQNADEIK